MRANEFFREVKGKKIKDYHPEIIAWQRENIGNSNSLLSYKFPQPGDNIKSKKYFAVKDYEKAIVYNKGEIIGVLKGGVYELDKKARIKGTAIVWIDTSFIDIQWGIAQSEGIPTKDGYIIGLHGDLKLRINDVKTFYNDVIAGKEDWNTYYLKNFIMSLLHSSLRDIFKTYNAKNIILEDRERLINLVTTKIIDEFLRYGLELETFNIIGIKDAENLFKEDKEKIEYLINQKKDLRNRIEELKNKLKEQQDLLLNNKIDKESFDNKKKQIEIFIKEAQDELRKIEEKLTNN